MKNLLYNQIISLVITMIIILNYKFSFFDDLFEKYLSKLAGILMISNIFSIKTINTLMLRTNNSILNNFIILIYLKLIFFLSFCLFLQKIMTNLCRKIYTTYSFWNKMQMIFFKLKLNFEQVF